MSAKLGSDSSCPRSVAAARPDLAMAVVLVMAAFAIRGWQFGQPFIHVDEDFYLMVGDRMLHGALPYVDVWDRKPLGLFVLFAAIRLLGGDGIVQYQVVAALFAAGTAIVIAKIAMPMAGRIAALIGGLVYLLAIGLVGGAGGQAPVFYNLFVACAALMVLKAQVADDGPAVRRRGVIAMGLVGVAMQIKYTAVFEGVFFGLALVWISWRTSQRLGRTVSDAAVWVAVAVAPTGLALAIYLAMGHGEAFIYANFLSIGDRSGASGGELMRRLGKAWAGVHIPLFCVVMAGLLEPWRGFARGRETFGFSVAWLAAALVGYLAFGTYFNHYALPLFVPLAAAGAPLFAYNRGRVGAIIAACVLLAGGLANGVAIHKARLKRGGRAEMSAMVEAIKPHLTNCLYVWNGDPLLYSMTGSCLPTRYPFAGHLNLLREHGAIGVEQLSEVRRILAGRPSVIVDREPTARDFNFAVVAIVKSELAANYSPVKIVPLKKDRLVVYARRPGR